MRGEIAIDALGADPVRLLQPSRSRPHEDPSSSPVLAKIIVPADKLSVDRGPKQYQSERPHHETQIPLLDLSMGAAVQPAPMAGAFPHLHLLDSGTVVGLSAKGHAAVWPGAPPDCPFIEDVNIASGSVLGQGHASAGWEIETETETETLAGTKSAF